MKKCFSLSLSICFALGLFAQNDTYKHTFHFGAGLTGVGLLINLADGADLSEASFDLESDDIQDASGMFMGNANPAIQFAYDYGLVKWFSLGASVSYQRLGVDFTDFSYIDGSGQFVDVGDLSVAANRLNLTLRTLFHYGNSDKIDMYSGFRLGVTNWGLGIETNNSSIEEDLETSSFAGIAPTGQLIPFALRAYFNENLGISFELGIGAPHAIALGVNYRM
ncbi:MAG: hypothetical protein AAF847_06065 [Bacteroidota bacterium]